MLGWGYSSLDEGTLYFKRLLVAYMDMISRVL